MEMRDKNSNYEKAYTVGLKAMMETLEQIRYYHYLEDVKKNLISDSECHSTRFVCDLLDAIIETSDVSVIVSEIENRKAVARNKFKKCIANLFMLPSDIQKEFLRNDYYYNPQFVEDITSQMDVVIKQTDPFTAFDMLVDYMKAYGTNA